MFQTHKLNEQGFKAMSDFKTEMSQVVSKAMDAMPEGRDKTIFKTKVEEAVFFGAKAIAGTEGNFTEIVDYPEYTSTSST